MRYNPPVAIEIERTFLVDRLPDDLPEGQPLRQGYVALDPPSTVRVRAYAGHRT